MIPQLCNTYRKTKTSDSGLVSTAHAMTSCLLQLCSLHHGIVLGNIDMLRHNLLQHIACLGGVLALGADPVTILVEQERERHTGEGQESGDGTGPVDA